jgi:membrane protease YdiL (CAAX protease family)
LATGSEGEWGIITKVVLSLGAGIYEETVFRLIGMGGLYWLARKVMDIPSWMAAIAALLISSFVFSAIHYVGPLGDAFTMGSFLFRFFAGILLAAIFYLRGFAVAVYTHAIYDIIVMVFR